jgi:hypothetical protein
VATRKVEIRLSVDDIDAGKRLDAIAAKLNKLSKNIFKIRLRLDDGGAAAKLDKMSAKLDKIGSKTYTPKIGVGGIIKADAALDKVNVKLDKLNHKRVTSTVHIRTTGGGGGGSAARDAEKAAAAGGGTGALAALGGANNSLFGGLIAALIGYIAAIAPAIIPFGIGGLVGGAGALAASKLGTTGITKLRADQLAVARAQAALAGKGANTPTQRLSLQRAQTQLARDQAKYGGFVPFGQATNQLGRSALGSLLGAVTGSSPGFSAGPHGQPGGSFLQGLTPIFTQIGAFLKQIGPGLGSLFRASLPSLTAFVKIFEQFAKAVMPAMTQSLKALNTSGALPLIIQGFKFLSEGIAGFITNLGPGMRAGAIIFKESMLVVKGFLQLAGKAATTFADIIVRTGRFVRAVARGIPPAFDKMRHETAVIFDGVRHDIAHVWDMIWNNTIGRISRGVGDVMNWDANLRHGIANTYDTIRHSIASAWDTIWNNTVGRVERGVSDVVGWFRKLPGQVGSALKSLGSMLLSIGKSALNDFLSGLKSVGGSILSWIGNFFKGIPTAILHFFHMSPPHPGSVFFDLGANLFHHLEAGMKSRAGSLMGAAGHVAGSVAGIITQVLKMSGKPMSWLPALERLVSLESGGNARAVNPVSVGGQHATGMWQMLPSTFAGEGGRGGLMGMFNPIIEGLAALRYISSRYGSPFNIPGLFGGGYQGYKGGGVITEPIFGVGLSGKAYGFGEGGIHERVTPLGAGGGGGGNVYITVQGDTDPDGAALRIVQKLRKYKTHHGGAALGIG